VTSVAFSPDGSKIASGSVDNTIKLWRVSDGSLLRTLEGHTGPVTSVAFSPDGSKIASGGGDWTIKLWRVSDGELLRTLEGHTDAVASVAFSPDGSVIASGGGWNDKTIKLWLVSDGALLKTYDEETAGVTSIAYSPDGRLIAWGRGDATLVVARNPFAVGVPQPPPPAQKGVISIGDYTGIPGSIISVDVVMDENVKNIAGIQLTVEFLESTIAGAPPLVALENPLKPGSGEADLIKGPRVPAGALVVGDAKIAGKLRVGMVGVEGFSGPGPLITFKLSIPTNAPEGARYTLHFKNVVANDPDINPIELKLKDGSVTIVSSPSVRGDISGDGKVNISDATVALRIAVGLEKASDAQIKAGDLNGNGKIDIPDVTKILRAAIGLERL
jgi:hypothetical protein